MLFQYRVAFFTFATVLRNAERAVLVCELVVFIDKEEVVARECAVLVCESPTSASEDGGVACESRRSTKMPRR